MGRHADSTPFSELDPASRVGVAVAWGTLFCSGWIMFTLLVLDRRSPPRDPVRRLCHRYLNMLVVLSALDFADGSSYLLTRLNGSDAVCEIQGAIMQVSEVAIFVWTACQATELWFVISPDLEEASGLLAGVRGEEQLSSRHRAYALVTVTVSCGLCLVLVLWRGASVFLDSNSAGGWCWISEEEKWLQFWCYYAILGASIAYVTAVYVRIGFAMRRSEAAMGATTRRRALRLALFPMAFVFVWVWEFIYRVEQWTSDEEPGPIVSALSGALTPMSGVANALAYGLSNPRVKSVWHRALTRVCGRAPKKPAAARTSEIGMTRRSTPSSLEDLRASASSSSWSSEEDSLPDDFS